MCQSDGPGKLAEAGDAACLGHARQAEIEPVGEQPRHQDAAIGGGLAGAQMSEAVGEQRPARHLGQQIGDADARQHGVEPRGQGFSLRRCRLLDRRDLQHTLVDRDARQQADFGTAINRRQPFVQQDAATCDETLEIQLRPRPAGYRPAAVPAGSPWRSAVPRTNGIAGCRRPRSRQQRNRSRSSDSAQSS